MENSIVHEPCTFISFRVTHEKIEEKFYQDYYIDNIQNYLKTKEVCILKASVGFHKNSAYPHIHYHLVIKHRKLPKSLIQDWKYNYMKNKIALIHRKPSETKNTRHPLPCLWSYKCGTQQKLNISIRANPMVTSCELDEKIYEENETRFLQYPFKEKYPISVQNACVNIDYKALTIAANTLYMDALKKAKQKEDEKTKSIAAYTKIEKFIIESQLTDYNDIIIPVLEHARDFEKPIHYRKVMEHAQTICYRLKIIQLDELASKFYL